MITEIAEVGVSMLAYLSAIVISFYCLYAGLIVILNEVPSIPVKVEEKSSSYILSYRGEEVRKGNDFTLFVGVIIGILLVVGIVIILLGVIGVMLGIPTLGP